jgi:hypothetical protein
VYVDNMPHYFFSVYMSVSSWAKLSTCPVAAALY